MPDKNLRGLYVLTPERFDAASMQRIQSALKCGVSYLQYRDKSRPEGQKLKIAQQLAAWCREYGSVFIVNDHVSIARAVNADRIHHTLGHTEYVAYSRRQIAPE